MSAYLLVIEDEDQIRHNLVELLTLSGYKVASASSGLGGLALARQCPPELILCDIMMPQMDGYQVLEAIRLSPGLAHLPFVFLTAKSDMVDLRRGMSLGADDYLTKPFMIKDLLAAVESRLKRYQLTLTLRPASDYLTTIQGHDEKGTMTLPTAECLFFYVVNRQCFVRHPLGTFQINRSLDTLVTELDPTQFFRANRQILLHRQTVRKYTYWDKGKYCLYLDLVGQSLQATITRARFAQFKHWLAGSYT